jgi:hypothetical protein
MKFYIASSLRNVVNVRYVAEGLKSCGFIQTYDWTTHSMVDSISKLREIGHKEVAGVLDADVTKKKIYLYSSTHEINDIDRTSTFYHLDEVEQCIGSLKELISIVSMSHTPTSLNGER